MIIWLASYPRSGNTFIRTILNHAFNVKTYSIYNDKWDIAADEATTELVGHQILPQNFDFNKARVSKDLYFIKTHDHYKKDFENDKVIYIHRDGRESTVSFYYYLVNFIGIKLNYLELINGYHKFGSWGDHYISWISNKNLDILLLSFKESIQKPVETINQISKFIGLVPVNYEVPGFEKLHSVNPSFFRSGKVDSFKKELSDYEQKYFWLVNRRVMMEIGYSDQIPTFKDNIERDELILTHTTLTSRKSQNQLENKIEELKLNLLKIEQLLNKSDELIKIKDNLILQLNDKLSQKTDLLIQKDYELIQKDYELIQKNYELIQKNEEIKRNEVKLNNTKVELIKNAEELIQIKLWLNNIRNSISFRLGQALTWPVKKIIGKK
jgi:hypothetical protein